MLSLLIGQSHTVPSLKSKEKFKILSIQHDCSNMKTSAQAVFYLTCVFLTVKAQRNNQTLASSVHQERRFMSVKAGNSVTLHCFYEGDLRPWFYWYKQSRGEKPRIISTCYVDEVTFHDEFNKNPRFTLDAKTDQNHLIISDLQLSDSATYYCIHSIASISTFAQSITLIVKDSGSNINALVQQSVYGTIQPGGSVTLNCTVHTGTCDGEHSVYWFKDLQESHPGLIYTRGGRNDQCERKPNTQTHTCVYNLTMRSLNVSQAGTYYCAVASCGHILFGEGTKLDFEAERRSLILRGAFALITILSISLISSLCVIIKMKTECCTRCSNLSRKDEQGYQEALKENKIIRSTRKRDDTWSECVYFNVKQ